MFPANVEKHNQEKHCMNLLGQWKMTDPEVDFKTFRSQVMNKKNKNADTTSEEAIKTHFQENKSAHEPLFSS